MLNSSSSFVAFALLAAGLLGLIVGSFVGRWARRHACGKPVADKRPRCTSCGHELGARDLIPVFSWIATRGTCRYCSSRISVRYLVAEVVSAITFVAIVATYGPSLESMELLAFSSILLFLALVDIEKRIIPNGCIALAIAVRAIYLAISFVQGTITASGIAYFAASAFGMGITLLAVVLLADWMFGQASMGGGDLKLFFVAALYFGWQQGLFLIMASCVFGIATAVVASRLSPPAPSNAPGAHESRSVVLAPTIADATATPGANAALGASFAPGVNDEDATATPGANVTSNATAAPGANAALGVATTPGEGGAPGATFAPGENARTDAYASASAPGAHGAQASAAESPRDPGLMKRKVPFGPSIAAACVLTMLLGNPLVSWYAGLL